MQFFATGQELSQDMADLTLRPLLCSAVVLYLVAQLRRGGVQSGRWQLKESNSAIETTRRSTIPRQHRLKDLCTLQRNIQLIEIK